MSPLWYIRYMKYFKTSADVLLNKLDNVKRDEDLLEIIENHLKRVALDAVLDSEVEAEAAGNVPTRKWMPDTFISSPWDLTPEDF